MLLMEFLSVLIRLCVFFFHFFHFFHLITHLAHVCLCPIYHSLLFFVNNNNMNSCYRTPAILLYFYFILYFSFFLHSYKIAFYLANFPKLMNKYTVKFLCCLRVFRLAHSNIQRQTWLSVVEAVLEFTQYFVGLLGKINR